MKGNPMYRNFGIGKSPAKQATISSVSDSLQNKPNPAIEKLIKELEETQDSTNTANQAELERRAKQIQQNVSPREFNKQIEEYNEKISPTKQISKPMGGPGEARKDDSPAKQPWGDYYDTRSKSPNKQTYYGGTESEKGNIFTKKGREQRKVNKFKKTQKKLLDNVNKEGYDTKKSKRLMKKANKRLSKTSQIHQDVQSGKKVIYKGGDPKDNSNYISNQN